jgi:hypothetical protein
MVARAQWKSTEQKSNTKRRLDFEMEAIASCCFGEKSADPLTFRLGITRSDLIQGKSDIGL